MRGEMRKSRCEAVCKVVHGKRARVDLYRQGVHIREMATGRVKVRKYIKTVDNPHCGRVSCRD